MRWFALTILLWSAAMSGAEAHSLRIFATVIGADIQGHAFFVGGGRPRDALVTITTPRGRALGETRTAEDGTYAFTARERVDHVIRVDAGDGHVATTTIPAARLPDNLPRGTAGEAVPGQPATTLATETPASCALDKPALSAEIERAVAAQVAPLAAGLAEAQARVRLSDILGGLGTLFGLAGVWMMAAARRSLPREGTAPDTPA
jgi:nickel transport protein